MSSILVRGDGKKEMVLSPPRKPTVCGEGICAYLTRTHMVMSAIGKKEEGGYRDMQWQLTASYTSTKHTYLSL